MISRGYISDIEKRRKQIDTLKIFNDNVIEIIENEEYRVEFKSGGRHMSVCVLLGPGFPVDKPRLLIRPIVQHSWIQQMTGEVIDAPGLLNFTVHSDLGRVVQAIIREFERNPPSPVDSGILMPQTSVAGKISYKDNLDTSESGTPIDSIRMQLQQLNNNELRKLLNDDHLDEFLSTNEQMQQQTTDLDNMMQNVESIANSTIVKEAELEKLKKNLMTSLEMLSQLRQSCESLNDKYQQMADRYAPQNICELLQKFAATCDRDCEEIAEMFLNGEYSVELFISEFMSARKLSHSRKAKEERLQIQLNALERAGF
ncbi:vacuolar protein sorting-associated protein 37A [Ctenocephalides felis]|uniref:vacuolar protein sorting-associated protein 37A n=1 Tax=Ctenocephalides felis TaxID=7515 RepID=UPI000E6E4E56|nr:vacuolar protein sorting-associated protein 37A [Ctenocephalides felis]